MDNVRLLAVVDSDGGDRSANRTFETKQVARMFGTDIIFVPGTTAEILPEWQGQGVCFLEGCTVTVPSDLPLGFSCGWSQESADPIVFVAGAGATVQSYEGNLTSAGQYAVGGVSVWPTGVVRITGQLVA